MKPIRNFFYLFGQGIVGIFRNSIMSTASVLVLVCCMLIVGTFGMVVKAIDDNLEKVDTLNVIVAYIDPSATEADITAMTEDITSRYVGVSVKFVSKEEGLAQMREEMSEIDLDAYFNGDRENPLPDTLEITFDDPTSANALNSYVAGLKASDDRALITETKHKIGLVEKVDSASAGLMAIAMILMAVLLIVALFVIMNTIRLGMFARREEIAVMRYFGATGAFIVMPFIIEGVLLGAFSAALAYGMQYYLYANVITDIVSSYGIGALSPFGESAFAIGSAFLGIGLFAGIVASGISIKKYMKA